MNVQDILHHVDHTLLTPTATWPQIQTVCDEALHYQTASVCISPCWVKKAADYVGNRLKICTVIGFPNGCTTSEVKIFETEEAIRNGADEIDMVINLGWVKNRLWDEILSEIKGVKESCGGRVLKVIIETCLLDEEEKIELCKIVSASGADYIKTSTGFSSGGATREDIVLFKAHLSPDVNIKAAGGISSLQDAQDFIALGADRLGTSKIIKLVQSLEENKNS